VAGCGAGSRNQSGRQEGRHTHRAPSGAGCDGTLRAPRSVPQECDLRLPALVRLMEGYCCREIHAVEERMRAFRGLTITALLLLNVGAAGAQASRGFKDSWFWGAKFGLLNYQVWDNSVARNSVALLAGGDWLITRSNGGLYVSFDYSFFSADSVFVNDSISPLDSVPRIVQLGGLRRMTMAAMVFPAQSFFMHPYLGFGVTLAHIARANPQGTYRSATQEGLVLSTVELFRSTATPVVIIGTQLRFPLTSVFGQVTASPANNNFFLFTGRGWRTTLEVGLRYNVGTSIDRMR